MDKTTKEKAIELGWVKPFVESLDKDGFKFLDHRYSGGGTTYMDNGVFSIEKIGTGVHIHVRLSPLETHFLTHVTDKFLMKSGAWGFLKKKVKNEFSDVFRYREKIQQQLPT